MSNLVPTVGIEVHCELKTKNKAFSPTLNTYGEDANTKINEIDFGYPGILPTLNKDVIDIGIRCALALNCKINKTFRFDRKNYFYPDLPKGYQITQKRNPIGYDGYVEIEVDGIKKKIEIEEMHIEEDTCKSIHDKGTTLLDFNRAGIPLIEIVTKPVIDSEREAVLYLEKLREILLYADISDVKIEEGSMRCDVNISLRESDSTTLGTKIEIKNVGSISAVALSILYEMKRQKELIDNGIVLKEETRKYDEITNSTILMRTKETKNDYRYFPEPDIPLVVINDEWIDEIKESMPMLPDEIRNKYKSLGINDIAINALILYRDLNKFLTELIDMNTNPIVSANIITGDVLAYLNKHSINIGSTKLTPVLLKGLIDKLSTNEISSKIGKMILDSMLETGNDVNTIINEKELNQINNEEELLVVIRKVIDENISSKEEYITNPNRVEKYLMGQIMKYTNGRANPTIANEILIRELKK